MTVQISGVLVDPLNVVSANTEIRVTAKSTYGSGGLGGLASMVGSTSTDAEGAYDFTIMEGTHEIEVFITDTYVVSGTITLDGDTPSPLTLNTLIDSYSV